VYAAPGSVEGWRAFLLDLSNSFDGSGASFISHVTVQADANGHYSVTGLQYPYSSANRLRITLKWSDTAANELGFKVERSLDGTSFTEIAMVGADITTYTDSGLAAMTTYYYRVTAYNTVGVSPPSNTASAKTKAR
jgi:hypothetical protein